MGDPLSGDAAIPKTLDVGYRTQIVAAIVETVAIDVGDVESGRLVHNDAVDQNRARAPVWTLGVASRIAAAVYVPFPARHLR
jgi:hypothetical protein